MSNWHANWAWGIPLIIINVVIHVLGLGLINERVLQVLRAIDQRHFTGVFAMVMGVVALLATILHAMEGMVWATAYRLLDALPGAHSAVLYSLSAVTATATQMSCWSRHGLYVRDDTAGLAAWQPKTP